MSLFILSFQRTYVTLYKIKMGKKQGKKKKEKAYHTTRPLFMFRCSTSIFLLHIFTPRPAAFTEHYNVHSLRRVHNHFQFWGNVLGRGSWSAISLALLEGPGVWCRGWVEVWLCHFLAAWPWPSHLISAGLNVLSYEHTGCTSPSLVGVLWRLSELMFAEGTAVSGTQ